MGPLCGCRQGIASRVPYVYGMSDVGDTGAADAAHVAGAGAVSASDAPESYLIVHNVSKKHNVGNMIRSASAFGVTAVLVVGARKMAMHGAFGAHRHIPIRHFDRLEECVAWLRARGGVIYGVEIAAGAEPVQSHPFSRCSAFMLGNEVRACRSPMQRSPPRLAHAGADAPQGSGMSERQMAACDRFLYIPHYGGGTASLNVTVAASIVMHHFGLWAALPERPIEGHKFMVDEVTVPTERTQEDVEVAEARRARRQADAECDVVPAQLFE